MVAVTRASRRAVLHGIGATTVALLTGCSVRMPFAANVSPMRRIGYLTGNASIQNIDPDNAAFRQGLRDLGYIEGQNLTIELRYANFNTDVLPALAAGLLADGVEVLVTSASPAAVAAKRATQTVPVVFMEVNDPVGQGIVSNLAHPGGNVTGVSTLSAGISGKRIELLRETLPNINHIAILWYAANPGMVSENRDMLAAAAEAGLSARSYGLHGPDDMVDMLAAAQQDGAEALVILPSTPGDLQTIVSFAANARLAILCAYRDQVVAGALMSLAPAYLDMRRRAAAYVDKILRGTRPGDLPVEQPQRFDFIINLGTARALGITLSESVLLQATEVLQ
jgi:putative tryptophan/tyrosine transport system substrate-binding protein